MGVFHTPGGKQEMSISLPHARGGVSTVCVSDRVGEMSSPRPWGCFLYASEVELRQDVFPTPVGVFLLASNLRFVMRRLPHARGGVSKILKITPQKTGSSPRPWGCFSDHALRDVPQGVFPTPVGVFQMAL